MSKGLFVGLITLDLVYLTEEPPKTNQKIVASEYAVAAGGPATNAAVTFSYCGNLAKILCAIGNHPITHLIRTDLEKYCVTIADLDPSRLEPPPVSSIMVTQSTGERAVVSINATKSQISPEIIPADILFDVEVVLIDGHQMEVGKKIAELGRSNDIPIVIDGGSWKSGFEELLPLSNYAICSANFYPPGCQNQGEVMAYLSALGIPHIAITQGKKPIQYLSEGKAGWVEVPQIQAVDTLGAGDVFHGAFCDYILDRNFTAALDSAAKIAAKSCQFFGTRRWMC